MKNKNIMFSPGLGIRSFRFHAIRTFFRSFALFQKSGGALFPLFLKREKGQIALFTLFEKSGKKSGALFLTTFWRKTPFFTENPGFFGENLGFLSKIFVHNVHKKERITLSLFSKRVERADRSFWNEGRAKERMPNPGLAPFWRVFWRNENSWRH